jgi:hypothetical protein
MLLDPPLEYLRDAVSFSHAMEIAKPWGMIEQVLDWCKMALSEDWRWQLVESSAPDRLGRYIFYFDSERDYMTFALRWR